MKGTGLGGDERTTGRQGPTGQQDSSDGHMPAKLLLTSDSDRTSPINFAEPPPDKEAATMTNGSSDFRVIFEAYQQWKCYLFSQAFPLFRLIITMWSTLLIACYLEVSTHTLYTCVVIANDVYDDDEDGAANARPSLMIPRT